MQNKGVVVSSVANLYSEPSKAVDLVTQAILGMELSIYESRDGWHRVQTPDDYQGWIEASHVRNCIEGDPPYASAGQVVEIDSLLAFLYHEPSASARAPALQVTLGTRLEVTEAGEGWFKVVLPDGAVRWVQEGDVSAFAPDVPRSRGSVDSVITMARRFLGLPYLWGGSTPLGIDCSAFVQLVYQLNGVGLLRDSHLQFTQPNLETVARQVLKAGDLVFFGQERITHVGMCIGGGQFIHATTHGRPVVQISYLDEPHWVSLYRGARRP